MGIKRISSQPGLPTGFPFSLGCDANGTCFISGMPALDPDGKFVPGTFAEEADLAWHNVIAIAEASGYSGDEIVYVQCVLGDMANYGTTARSTTGGGDDSPTCPEPRHGLRSRLALFRSGRRSRSRRWPRVGD